MPSKGSVKSADMRRKRRPKVAFTEDELAIVEIAAKASGRTKSRYMREAVLAATGHGAKPKQINGAAVLDLAHKLTVVGVQLKKLGANINQLAHQANAGLVPISRREAEYMLNLHQLLLSKASAAVESLVR